MPISALQVLRRVPDYVAKLRTTHQIQGIYKAFPCMEFGIVCLQGTGGRASSCLFDALAKNDIAEVG